MATVCGRYIIDRRPNYAQHPAMTYVYAARSADMQANPLGEFKNFKLAAEACELHLQQHVAASTTEGDST